MDFGVEMGGICGALSLALGIIFIRFSAVARKGGGVLSSRVRVPKPVSKIEDMLFFLDILCTIDTIICLHVKKSA